MLCQSCEKRSADMHIKTILNGELKEMHLCSDCAVKLGYSSFMGFNFDKLFGSLMEGTGFQQMNKRCPDCGSEFNDIVRTGKVGCASCYTTFYHELLPSIQRIHGRTHHTGKLANSAGTEVKIKNEISKCRNELQQAIKDQEFERAAELRDKIRELEKNIHTK